MSAHGRAALAVASVATLAVALLVALALGPDVGPWLPFCALLAVASAIQAVAADARDLTPTLALALPPLLALVAEGSPTWMIGPLGALLLVSGELNALSWKWQGGAPPPRVRRRLLVNAGRLAALGLGASLAVGAVAQGAPAGGTLAVVAAAAALAGVGAVVFRGAR